MSMCNLPLLDSDPAMLCRVRFPAVVIAANPENADRVAAVRVRATMCGVRDEAPEPVVPNGLAFAPEGEPTRVAAAFCDGLCFHGLPPTVPAAYICPVPDANCDDGALWFHVRPIRHHRRRTSIQHCNQRNHYRRHIRSCLRDMIRRTRQTDSFDSAVFVP